MYRFVHETSCLKTVIFVAMLSLLTACGGGGGGTSRTGSTHKTVSLKFSTNNTDVLGPLGLIELTVQQPSGVNVSSTTCKLESTNSIGVTVYSAENRTLNFTILTKDQFAIPVGEFASLSCEMEQASLLNVTDFQTDQLLKYRQLLGYSGGSVDLTNLIPVTITASIN